MKTSLLKFLASEFLRFLPASLMVFSCPVYLGALVGRVDSFFILEQMGNACLTMAIYLLCNAVAYFLRPPMAQQES